MRPAGPARVPCPSFGPEATSPMSTFRDALALAASLVIIEVAACALILGL
jgi:hypothetical protein